VPDGRLPRWSHLSELGTSEKTLATPCAVEGWRPKLRAAAESTCPTDYCAERMNDLQKALPLEFMNGSSYTKVIEFAEPLARRRGSALMSVVK
jgi:hypothetical protein